MAPTIAYNLIGMLSLLKKIRIDLFIVFLIFLSSVLFFLNYSPNTFLSGWDTLHPEFNLQLYLSRILSVWQSHQGLGAPPAQAHAAELPRMIIVWLFTVMFPLSFVRYAYFFLMMLLGPVGIYLLLKYILTNHKHSNLTTSIASCLGGVFYLFNVGTMQHFIVPLEMFATKFGLLGFLYLFAIKFIDSGAKKPLILFAIATFFASPMAHTSTLWYVYFGGLVLFGLSYSLLRRSKLFFRRSFILIILSLLLNAYWILPNIYYGVSYGEDLRNSKIHRLFSQEAYNVSKKFGNITDLAYMRNFLFDWTVFDNNKVSSRLLSSWIQHLSQPYMKILALIFPISSLIGIFLAIKKRNVVLLSLIPVFAVMTSFLLSDLGGGLSPVNVLVERSTFLKELLRFPFTKFSLYFIFIFTILFAFAQQNFLTWLRSRFSSKHAYVISSMFFYGFVVLILFYAKPAIQGQFISPVVKIKIPQDYFETFKFLDRRSDGRILTLPMHTVFGWNYFDWSEGSEQQLYQGAGFNWFGIKQATLNREFDRWYPSNEQSYRELSYALYSNSNDLFYKLLAKYNIRYLLLDENVVLPDNNFGKGPLFYPETKLLLSSLKDIHLIKSFGKISIYEVRNARSEISVIKNIPQVAPIYRWNYLDSAYLELGDYISDLSQQTTAINYPSRNIFKENERVNNAVLQIDDDSYRIQLSDKDSLQSMPDISKLESQIYADVYLETAPDSRRSLQLKYFLPHAQNQTPITQTLPIPTIASALVSINDAVMAIPETTADSLFLGETLINTQKENVLNVYDHNSVIDYDLPVPKVLPYLCSDPKANQLFGATESLNNLRLYSQNAKVCAEFGLADTLPISAFNNVVMELNFDYRLANINHGSFCLFDALSNSCRHQQNLSTYIFDTGTSKTLTPFYAARQSSNLTLRFSFENVSDNSIEDLEVLNLRTKAHPLISSSNFSAKFSANKLSTNPTILQGDFPHDRYNIPAEKMVSELRDCSLAKSTLINKRAVQINDESVIEYEAKNGVMCDGLSLPNVTKTVGYILGIESQNISGLPIKFCLQQLSTEKCVMEEELSRNNELSTDYFIVPPYYQNSDYSLIIKNISLSNNASVNRLKKVQFIPFPYNYLQALRTNSEIPSSTVLVLDQAYEKGWMAFQVQSSKFKVQILKDHVLVNNWANGWILPNEFQNSNFKFQIHTVFWPQYLQYLGFAILLATGLYLWKKQA